MYVCMYTALITHQYVMQMGWKKASFARIVVVAAVLQPKLLYKLACCGPGCFAAAAAAAQIRVNAA